MPHPTPTSTAGPGVQVTGRPVPTGSLPDPGTASNWRKTVMEKIDAETEKPGQLEKYLGLVGNAVAPSTIFAELTVSPAMNASMVIDAFTGNLIDPGIAMVDVADAIRRAAKKIEEGDLSPLESMLVGQAHALGVIFTSLAIKAQTQTSQRNIESCMGLALKAQAASRATVEALFHSKHPRPAPPVGEGRAQAMPPTASEQAPTTSVVSGISPLASKRNTADRAVRLAPQPAPFTDDNTSRTS